MKYFGYTIADFIPCELCNARATETHHIAGRGKGMDVVTNLMAVCRTCHSDIHNEKISRYHAREVHNLKMLAGGEMF